MEDKTSMGGSEAPKASGSMITGPIGKSLFLFAVPLLLSSLFQQLYNTADSLIVGNFLGDSALAAVSSSRTLIFLMVDLFNGMFAGAGVLVANAFGSGDRARLSHAVHTTVAFGAAIGLALTVLGNVLAPVLLRMMETPESVMRESLAYFRVYFSGSLAFMMYNCCSGILRNIGDSVHPLIYLVTASIVNVILDVLFVGVMGFGVGSAALATVISQGLSALLCLMRLCREPTPYQVSIPKVRFHRRSFRQLLRYGIPSGFQNSVVAFSNVFIQTHINVFGVKAIAGSGVWAKLEGFAVLPIGSFSMALSTFVGQNQGARRYGRIRRGSLFGMACCAGMSVATAAVLWFFVPTLASFFNRDAEIIAFSTMQARIDTPFLIFLGLSNCMGGILRGAGRTRESMMIYLLCWCVVRVAFISIGIRIWPDIRVVFGVKPLTWALSTIVFACSWRRLIREFGDAR